ncbi:GTP pyrophosphokinase family protein [Metasolibacillus sp.]|uniref:GTP pyrophosphokinase n=1 Tax=Metasolibacillus sp. TaxID=2703680 RepID=UPI0025D90CFB|nr:GTP pyrophosphokinase family protein [Metasolibacillus sp.]MCT6926276.1 GTP pyrophosphokinase family protein [Metasolibacillus sp.]MCT6942511.1 GTP pyrophosphokinase family protein [Metasolibacillus sp.]
MNTNIQINKLKVMADELKRFMLIYKFALDEMNTKISILKEEFQMIHDYNPIEHTSSRLKSPESILGKIMRKNMKPSLLAIRENMRDIAGIRITCSFRSDIYRIKEMLCNQQDIELVECIDYIESPKNNGYQSLHLIVKVPVFMSDRVEKVYVEIQVRTIAMDFWASLEHKIYYKYDNAVPERLTAELKEAALAATELDRKMEALHQEVRELKSDDATKLTKLHLEKEQFTIPMQLIEMIGEEAHTEEEPETK